MPKSAYRIKPYKQPRLKWVVRKKDGTPSLQELGHINLYVLREHMTKIVDWLDAVSTYLSVWWDNATDAF